MEGLGGGRVERDKYREREKRDEGVGSVLFTLVFLSQSDAGVCRHAWRLSRCGLQHQDHYRENKKQGETEEERVKARDSERARENLLRNTSLVASMK